MVHVMVRDVSLSWFCHGSSWFVMFYCHGFVMVRDGLSWFVMVHVMVRDVSLSWFVMVRNVLLSWFHHGSSWFVMVRHGSRDGS